MSSALSTLAPTRLESDCLKQIPVPPEELEFFAEEELVTIIPNFSLDDAHVGSRLQCIGGHYGPFTPNRPVDVPLWLAIALHKRKRCRIQPPAWLTVPRLTELLAEEKDVPGTFQQVPYYYMEVAHLMFKDAVDAFGDDVNEVRQLIESLKKVRKYKIETGLQKIESAVTVKLNNLGASECNAIRLLFKGTLDQFHELAKAQKAVAESSMLGSGSMPF